MPSSTRNVSRVLALVTALLVGTAAVPEAAPASRASASANRFTVYRYYSNSSYSTLVGMGSRDCEGNYNLDDGYATQYVLIDYLDCPT